VSTNLDISINKADDLAFDNPVTENENEGGDEEMMRRATFKSMMTDEDEIIRRGTIGSEMTVGDGTVLEHVVEDSSQGT
jgi:hypothetical protein